MDSNKQQQKNVQQQQKKEKVARPKAQDEKQQQYLPEVNANTNIFTQLSQAYLQNKNKSSESNQDQQQNDQKQKKIEQPNLNLLTLSHFDVEIQGILQKLNKKSETTKLKALNDLKLAIQNKNDESFFDLFIPTWINIYKQSVTTEFEKKISFEAQNVLGVIIQKAKKKLSPYFKELYFFWVLAMHDTSNDVQLIARQTFESTFPKEKHQQALKISREQFIQNVCYYLRISTQQIIEENGHLNPQQAADINERLIIQTLQCISYSFQQTTTDIELFEYLINQLDQQLNILQPNSQNIKNTLLELLDSNKKKPKVRATALELLGKLISLPATHQKYQESLIHVFTKPIINTLDDKERTVQVSLWKYCIVPWLSIVADSYTWNTIILDRKKFEIKLLECIKNAAYGASQIYNNILILISKIPYFSLTDDYNNQNLNTIQNLLAAYRNGFNHDEVKFFSDELTLSYFETLLFLTLKRFNQYDQGTGGDQVVVLKKIQEIVREAIQKVLLEYTTNHISTKSLSEWRRIPESFCDFLKGISTQESLQIVQQVPSGLFLLYKQCQSPQQLDNYYTIIKTIITKLPQTSYIFTQIQQVVVGLFLQFETFLCAQAEQQSLGNVDILVNQLIQFEKFVSQTLLEAPSYIINILQESSIQALNAINVLLVSLENKEKSFEKILHFEILARILFKLMHEFIYLVEKVENNTESITKINEILDNIITNLLQKHENNQYKIILEIYFLDYLCPEQFYTTYLTTRINTTIELDQIDEQLENFIHNEKKLNNLEIQIYQQNNNIQQYSLIFIEKILKDPLRRPLILIGYHLLKYSLNTQTTMLFIQNRLKAQLDSSNKYESLELSYALITRSFSSINTSTTTTTFELQEQLKVYVNRIPNSISIFYEDLSTHKSLRLIYKCLQLLLKSTLFSSDILTECLNKSFEVAQELATNLIINSDLFKSKLSFVNDMLLFILEEARTQRKLVVAKTSQILFQKILFQHALHSDRVWIVLKLLLEIASENTTHENLLHLENIQQFIPDNYWLVALLLSASNTQALVSKRDTKKYFIDIANNTVIEKLIQFLVDGHQEKIIQFLTYFQSLCLSENLIYTHGLRLLVRAIVIQDEVYNQTKQRIYELLLYKELKEISEYQLIEDNNLDNVIRKIYIIQNLLICFKKVMNLDQVQNERENLIKSTKNQLEKGKQILEKENENLIQIQLYLLCILQDYIEILPGEDDTIFWNAIIKYVTGSQWNSDALFSHQNLVNFKIAVYFEIVNKVIEKKTFEVFSNNIVQLESLFNFALNWNQTLNKYSAIAIVKLLEFIRKEFAILEIFTDSFQTNVLNNLLKACIQISAEITKKSDSVSAETELSSDEHLDSLLTEFAETIARMALAVNKNINENLIFQVIHSDYLTIQKSGFLLLKQYYDNITPVLTSDDKILLEEGKDLPLEMIPCVSHSMLERMFQDPFKLQQDEKDDYMLEDEDSIRYQKEQEVLNPNTFSYLLTWMGFALKLKAPNRGGENDIYKEVKLTLIQKLDENKDNYFRFLENLFLIVKKLHLHENDMKKIIQSHEVRDITPQWNEYLNKDVLFRVAVQTLFLFTCNFPSYTRRWVSEANKSLAKIAETCMKNFISQALFQDEIELIENAQLEWRTDEFNIYIMRSTRQIQAIYTKEDASLEIEITIPSDYPLRGVKIPEAKLNKWILMMRSLLMNQNNTILNSLLTWKKNLDKQFEGVEECAICYYCIHQTTGDLPKLACKTCKHKFHASCIKKWFATKNKSECPLCKSQFF